MTFESSSFEKNYSNSFLNEGTEMLLNSNGGTCIVYKINLHGKWVILKRIKPEYIGNPVIEKSFEKEFEIGFSLDHPHIIKYINKGNDKKGVFIITEYVDGKTLREHLNSGTVFSTEQIHKIIVQLFEAIAYLHKKNIIHLDLKPENILISDKTGNVKLIDFGFSYSDGQLPTIAGTKKYISAEQSINPETINCNNDFYSLGVIIIELFTRKADLSGVKQLPTKYRKVAKKCLDSSPEQLISADEMLVVLNSKSTNAIIYFIIGLITLFSIFFFMKNNIGKENIVELKGIESKTNWVALSVMPKGRCNGAVINYKDKLFYIAGGGADGGLMAYDVFEFDINTQKYSQKKSIGTARGEFGAAELNGKIYTFGGWLGNGITDTSEVYDIKLNEWSYLPPLPKKLTSVCACALNGKIYILGGTMNVTNTYFYEFDPLINSYKQLAVFSVSRNNACLAVVDGLIYAIGGNSYKNDNYFNHNNCDVYNTISNSWEQKTALPEVLTQGSAVVMGSTIHYLGGLSKPCSVTDADALTVHYIYDTKTDVWSNGENLLYGVWANECASVGNKIYLFGGNEKLPNASSKVFVLN
jgi:serine/threonine protein kinase